VGWKSRARILAGQAAESATEAEEPAVSTFPPDSAVLVAEIPKSGDRWNQANFDVGTYENYFGARVGTQRRIILQHISDSGQLASLESRPSVEVASQNYRFELAAAAGIIYPSNGRPIGVFIRQHNGVFIYRLILPSDSSYAKVRLILDSEWTGRTDRMRRVVTTAARLATYWPDAPFWTLDVVEE
jgi:hypothetical protein